MLNPKRPARFPEQVFFQSSASLKTNCYWYSTLSMFMGVRMGMGMFVSVVMFMLVGMRMDMVSMKHGFTGLGIVMMIGVLVIMAVPMVMLVIVVMFLNELGIFGRLAMAASAILAHRLLRGYRLYALERSSPCCKGGLIASVRIPDKGQGHFRKHFFRSTSFVLLSRVERQVPRADLFLWPVVA